MRHRLAANAAKARKPILPRSWADPAGQDKRERAAMADFKRRIAACGKAYQDLLARIDFESYTVNRTELKPVYAPGTRRVVSMQRLAVNAIRYEFRTDPSVFLSLTQATQRLVDAIMLEGGESSLWFSLQYVLPAYQQGTAMEWANLGAQSVEYRRARGELWQLLQTDVYQRRIALIRGREFELMQGLSAGIKQQMSQVLTQGLVTGLGPREIGRRLSAQVGIEQRRANRIARTEIGQAMRTARMQEDVQAMQDFGFRTMQLHLSALSPTTRLTHAARHGTLHTVEEQEAWWSEDGNAINCKCSTIAVLVDKEGKPLSPGIVAAARKQRDLYEAKMAA